MDPLSVFGLVCNVMQIVEFGLQSLSTFRQIAQRGATAVNLDIQYMATHLQDLAIDCCSFTTTSSTGTAVVSASDRLLQEVAQKTTACAEELVLKLNKLKADQKKGKIEAFVKTIRLIIERGELNDL